jgi:hypothetical protein
MRYAFKKNRLFVKIRVICVHKNNYETAPWMNDDISPIGI